MDDMASSEAVVLLDETRLPASSAEAKNNEGSTMSISPDDGVAVAAVNQEAVDAVVEDVAMQAAAAAAAAAASSQGGDDDTAPNSSKKKRLCRYPGCTRVIKSQGE